ncbi:uncharacterized protein TRAVEDRAFT_52789 [Trametes versicolor FP-101664 SS1]|uniref:uncharacterized protein n=1 Tax=Trametes versicolor (strain FP-101664) TaxID=717944 RepID=UPI00046224A7|nr:uncharacterized protein TRAVEDRAFT_52789 [Trametes versicolor FP-101664 SS1]EIW53671.1 hypothetical protein TRAVEDRAFT_52789 [Trametes versicolor FP-101664 SS1]
MANPTSVHEPYRDPSVGDLTIRTSDKIEFHVHRRRIADVSPVFSDMFSLPGPPADGKIEKQVVDVSEPSAIWSKLLPLVHVDEPTLSLADIYNLLVASDKYQMTGIKNRMRTHLLRSDVLDDSPYAVYALACYGCFEDVAGVAARRTLKLPVYPQTVPEFAYVSGRAIYRLLEYRQKCAAAARAAIKVVPTTPATSSFTWLSNGCPDSKTCDTRVCRRTSIVVETSTWKKSSTRVTYDIRSLWLEYLHHLANELEHNPHESVACSFTHLIPIVTSVMASCPGCSLIIHAEVSRFSQAAEEQIRGAVSTVKLVLES